MHSSQKISGGDKMQKWKYEAPEMKILAVDTEVVVSISGGDTDVTIPDGEWGGGSTQAVPAVEEMEI